MQQITKNVFTETTIRGCNPSILFTGAGAVFIDTAQWITTLLEMIEFAKKHRFDNIALVQATSPMLTGADLDNGFNAFNTSGTDSVLSVVGLSPVDYLLKTIDRDTLLKKLKDFFDKQGR